MPAKPERFNFLVYPLALFFGIACGVLHVMVETLEEPDPLLSALAVTAVSMAFGIARPQKPWRWVLFVGLPVPLVLAAAKVAVTNAHFTRATIAGAFLVALPSIAGAIGGSVLRLKVQDIFYGEE